MTYAEKLKDPRWQKKRLEILNRDSFTCRKCKDTKTTLHVHHTTYSSHMEPWEIPSEWLITLCSECHESEGSTPIGYKLLALYLKALGFLEDDAENLGTVLLSIGFDRAPTETIKLIKHRCPPAYEREENDGSD